MKMGKLAQRERGGGSIFRGQDQKVMEAFLFRARAEETHMNSREERRNRLGNRGRTGLFKAKEKLRPWRVAG